MRKQFAAFLFSGRKTVISDCLFKRHGSCAVDGVFIAARGAETAFAGERDKFKFTTFLTAIYGRAMGRVTTGNHFIYVIHDRITGMQEVFNFFIMFNKDLL